MSDPLHLLVVDDDELDRTAVRRALRKAQIAAEIDEADSVKGALDLLNTTAYDCVLLDYQLPGGDGLQLLRTVRQTGLSVPIIALTGQGDDEVAVSLIKAGAADYLSKASLSPERLVQAIRAAVRVGEAEAKAREAEAALRRNEMRFRLLHETSPDAFMILRAVRGADGEMVDAAWDYANPAAERMAGAGEDGLNGMRLLERMPRLQEAGVFELCRTVVADGEPRQVEVRYDQDGVAAWIRLTVAKVEDGCALTWADVTPRRRAEEERERAIAAQSRFYAAMSHEIRTPMNAVLGYTDLLLLGAYGPLNPEQRNGLERAYRAAQHLLELVNDVLDLSKLEAGKLEIELEPVDLGVLVQDLYNTVQPLATETGTEFRFHLDSCLPAVDSDPRRLRQILMNLFSNAIKFGRSRPVDIRCHTEGDSAVLEVTDHGDGIAPADLDRVFDEFVQLSTGGEGGTGLGLPISRRLAQLLGGRLEIVSEMGRGSTFRLFLPTRRGAPAGAHPTVEPPGAPADGPGGGPHG